MSQQERTDQNFIINFKPEEIRQIREDIRLYREGYTFFYAIDTYDIISHYLPYTDSDFLNGRNKNLAAQRAIAYEKFFATFLNNRLIVMDEYKIELLAAKNHIERQIKNTGFLNSNIHTLIDEIENIQNDSTTEKDKIRKNMELIVFLLILSENKGNAYHNFFDFLKTKISIFVFNTGDKELDEMLETAFREAIPSEIVGDIYDDFVQKIGFYLSGLQSDIERYAYLTNSYRDIEVLDRLHTVNSIFHHRFPEHKLIVTYLSSAPLKTKEIISLFRKNAAQDKSRQKEQYFNAFDFHRNIFQIFLFKVLLEEFPTESDPMPFRILDAMEKMVTQMQGLSRPGGKRDPGEAGSDLLIMMTNILDRYSSNIDNHFYFKIYNKYQAILDLSGTSENHAIANILRKVHDYVKDEKILTEGLDIFFNISQYKQSYLLSNILNQKAAPFSIHIHFGKDIVRDSFHHLPYLILVQENIDTEIANNLYPILDTISEIAAATHARLEGITPYLKVIFEEISKNSNNVTNLAIRFILTTYLYLIIDTVKSPDNKSTGLEEDEKEEEVIEVLGKQKKLLENSAVALSQTTELSKMAINKKDIVFSREFDYISLWMLRRNRFYAEAISLGNELALNYEDGRFFHGLALAYISQAYELFFGTDYTLKKSDTILDLFSNAMIYLRKAKDFYSSLVGTLKNPFAINLTRKTILAVLNSLADTSLRISILLGHSDERVLIEARLSIKEIKERVKEMNLSYDTLSVYNFTEAELEYFEALNLYNNNSLTEAHVKILHATSRLGMAIKTPTSMSEKFMGIVNDIEELRRIIFYKKGVLLL
jgi:hypothetical protein